MKNKEILEEFIKEITKNFKDEMSIKFTTGGIKLGAKWMQEQMYSKEDMLNFAWFLQENIGQFTCDKTAHFEGDYLKQFKKK